MNNIRQERVNSEIAKALSEIFPQLKDPRISGIISVMSVRVTRDFSFADVLVGIFGADNPDEVLDALTRSAGFIRKELRKYIGSIHTLPQLRFVRDDSTEKRSRIDDLLDQIKKKDE